MSSFPLNEGCAQPRYKTGLLCKHFYCSITNFTVDIGIKLYMKLN